MQQEHTSQILDLPSTTDPGSLDPQPPLLDSQNFRLGQSYRRRSVKACLCCRQRKVRCNVSLLGPPCTNCHLDEKPCIVADRASRRRLPSIANPDYEAVFATGNSSKSEDVIDIDAATNAVNSNQGFPTLPALNELDIPVDMGTDSENVSTSQEPEPSLEIALLHTSAVETMTAFPAELSTKNDLATDTALDLLLHIPPAASDPEHYESNSTREVVGPWGPSPSCPFLDTDGLVGLSQPDIVFLQTKGCFHIPNKPILDEFMREYFLHVHPFLPLLDEAEFWAAYRVETPDEATTKVPLLVFQAMLFTASNFVPLTVVQALDFLSIQSARAAFYNRAKALFDAGPEAPPAVSAHAAILLTMWCPPPSVQRNRTNTAWLSFAIHQARCAKAHLAWDIEAAVKSSESSSQRNLHDIQMLKRLWWCCIVRDRFLSIGMRRSMQIPTAYPILEPSDFDNELTHSEQAQPTPGRKPSGLRQRSVIVHTNLLHIFYFACRIALSHREMLLEPEDDRPPSTTAVSPKSSQGQEVREAALGMTSCLQELLQVDLIRYLPLSAIAFFMTPLLLHTLDFMLRPRHSTTADIMAKQERLKVFIDTMRTYRTFYDGIDWVSGAVRQAANLARPDDTSTEGSSATSWIDICFYHPSLYMRLALTLDMAVSEARVPQKSEIVALLQVHWTSSKRISNGPSLNAPQLMPATPTTSISVTANALPWNKFPGMLACQQEKETGGQDVLGPDDQTPSSTDDLSSPDSGMEGLEVMEYDDAFFGVTLQEWDLEADWPMPPALEPSEHGREAQFRD
ncbi:Cutinase transcription factor 1 beta like protein [Verticillium longisporum]|nr:Cutinase transcription factor 1 beta like protein [Verticillium longisporum]